MYIFHPGMDIKEEILCRNFYCTNIRNAVRKEVTNCDTCQRTKLPNEKDDKLPAKVDE